MEVERKKSVGLSSFSASRAKEVEGIEEWARERETERTGQTTQGKNAELLHAHVCVFDTVNERGSNQQKKPCNKCSENAMPNNERMYMDMMIWLYSQAYIAAAVAAAACLQLDRMK